MSQFEYAHPLEHLANEASFFGSILNQKDYPSRFRFHKLSSCNADPVLEIFGAMRILLDDNSQASCQEVILQTDLFCSPAVEIEKMPATSNSSETD